MSPIGISDFNSAFLSSAMASGAMVSSANTGIMVNLSPSLLAALAAGNTGLTTGTGAAAATSTVNVELLAALLPEAHEGHIITPEYHNALRAAILWLAQRSGVSLGKEQTLSLAPTFHRNGDNTEWQHANGIASALADTSTNGILPVNLPEAAQILSMTVLGRRFGAIDGFLVDLRRQAIKGSQFSSLITIPLEEAPENFEVKKGIEPTGVVAAAVAATKADYELVQNTKYKYMIVAEADSPSNLAELHAFQITYTT